MLRRLLDRVLRRDSPAVAAAKTAAAVAALRREATKDVRGGALLSRGAVRNDPSDFGPGGVAYSEGRKADARRIWEQEKDDDSRFRYAMCVFEGDDAQSPDPDKARTLLEDLPELPEAQYALAVMILGQDDHRALKLFVAAAKAGVLPAVRNAANLFASGRGCEKGVTSDQKAKLLYETAASTGDPEAAFILGSWACAGRPQGEPPDWDTGYKYHRIAADSGDPTVVPKARYNLGTHYFTGQGVDQDFARAAEEFEAASHPPGHIPEAMLNLANLLDNGLGRHRDPLAASQWREKAFALKPSLRPSGDEDSYNIQLSPSSSSESSSSSSSSSSR